MEHLTRELLSNYERPDTTCGEGAPTGRGRRNVSWAVARAVCLFAVCHVVVAHPAGAADTTAPSKPVVTDDGAYVASTTTLHATWSASDLQSGVAQYQYSIRRDTTSGTVVVNWTSVGTAATVNRSGLALVQDRKYFFGVRARNGAGLWSLVGYSDGIQVDATGPSAPGTPSEQSPDADLDRDGTYPLYWPASSDPGSGVINYEIQERVGAAGPWVTVVPAVAGTSTSLAGRLHGLTYYYRVRARNGAGTVGPLSAGSDGIKIDSEPPHVSDLGVSDVTATSSSLQWSTDEVAWCIVTCNAATPCLSTSPGVYFGATLMGLTPSTAYTVSASCTDAAGNQGSSLTTSFTTLTSPVPTQPSLVSVRGRQLVLQRRRPDGTLTAPEPYVIKGVNWSPASRATATSPADPNNVTVRRPEFGQWYLTDIPLLKAMNVNTVRLFMDPGLPTDTNIAVPGLEVLDELYRNGIMVIMTVDNGNNTVERIQPVLTYYKHHPAILMWSLGSEWDINRFWKPLQFPTVDSAAVAIENAARLVKATDPDHPVVSSYGSLVAKPNGIETYVTTICPSVDVWSFNEYRGASFSRLFEEWRFMSEKPMFLGEYGIDAFNSLTEQEDLVTQAEWDGRLWDEIARNLSATDPANVSLGGALFSWADELWKAGTWGVQDPGGWSPIGFPDQFASEDWWGLLTIDRIPRQAYAVMATKFRDGYQPPPQAATTSYRAVSYAPILARFWENGAVMYEGLGASLNGGRGFNIAAIDRVTKSLRGPIQRFDTWGSRTSGTAMNAMVAYLDSVPEGTLLLIAVGDEAGINEFSSCTPLPYSWTTSALERLEALGSNQIRSYCYGDQWAMITVKGQGSALSEGLGSRLTESNATAEATVDTP